MEFSWANQTLLHPLAAVLIVVLGTVMILSPRSLALLPLILIASIVSNEQRVVLGSLDFNVMRILVLIGWLRITLRSETKGFTFNRLDGLVIAWSLTRMFIYVASRGEMSALINQLGVTFDNVGIYFMMRCLIRTWDDLRRLGLGLAVIAIPLAAAFLFENRTARNMFSIFGGVPARTIERGGRLRAQGAFSHPIIAGVYFAITMPFIASNWWADRRFRWLVVIGMGSTMLIVVACSSSTPIASVMAGMLGAGIFLIRKYTGYLRWGAVVLLVVLHLLMNKPVWHLVSRITITSGNTGWHRYKLIDEAINRFGEWAVLGTRTTAHWGAGLWDITNEYLLQGVHGGFLTMVLFIATLTVAFRGVGRTCRAFESRNDQTRLIQCWAIGVALFMLCVSFIAVAAFAQLKLVTVLVLAIAGSMAMNTVAVTAGARRRIASDGAPGRPRPIRPRAHAPIRPRVEEASPDIAMERGG
jgi:hypothetical protein